MLNTVINSALFELNLVRFQGLHIINPLLGASDQLEQCVIAFVGLKGGLEQTLPVQFNGATCGEVLNYLQIEA